MTRAADRLGRMLAIVPYLVQHPGTTLTEAAGIFAVEPEDLRRDLELLFLSGLPPYGPGDLIDVEIDEEDGGIWIRMADHFARPLRLTRNEALALVLRGIQVLGTPGIPEAPDLATALDKLRTSLGSDAFGEDEGSIAPAGRGSPPEELEALRTAARERRSIEIEYFGAGAGRSSTRTVDPESVFTAMGQWYVVVWDRGADDERLLRADRVRSVRETGESFEPRGLRGAGRPLYDPPASAESILVELLLHPDARWIAEYYILESEEERPGGDVAMTLQTSQLGWVALLLLRAGEDAEILGPPGLRDLTHELAERTLALYR